MEEICHHFFEDPRWNLVVKLERFFEINLLVVGQILYPFISIMDKIFHCMNIAVTYSIMVFEPML